ncbi:AfsR/SARP family transcriptional regulator [Streptomyces sp. RB6PN25]|uniref:AfsR/SARP family transcriptional regulator n=1 Tax=Streptomyces humicola TaxID=2953240 RepID=A0ABT1Q127_9ACTN|nr:AfsR/SARP family transcriptional regulator [Streptomyces humicola]MCQ4083641.1 AfsR/SARP family transcriptional regulator [Streptomyces humicola]
MKIQVLGPLHAETGAVSAVPTAGKERKILALLALHPGQLVPVTTLIEEMWGPLPPRSAHTTVQTYILRLRRTLAAALGGPDGPARARELLATGHGGYLLRIAEEDIDAFAFQRAAQAGHAAFSDGDSELAARLLHNALALWRGPALVDVRAGGALRIQAARLEESRLLATERRIDAELRLGMHSQLLAELAELTACHPANERLHSQAMVAFYRSGRQSSALELYRGLRRRLIEQLGLEPSPQLQRLHQAMLSVDPRLDMVAQGGRPTPTFDLYAV